MPYAGASPTSRPAVAAFSPNRGWPRSLSSPLPCGTSGPRSVRPWWRWRGPWGWKAAAAGALPPWGALARWWRIRVLAGSWGARGLVLEKVVERKNDRRRVASAFCHTVNWARRVRTSGVRVIIAPQINAGWKHVPWMNPGLTSSLYSALIMKNYF